MEKGKPPLPVFIVAKDLILINAFTTYYYSFTFENMISECIFKSIKKNVILFKYYENVEKQNIFY